MNGRSLPKVERAKVVSGCVLALIWSLLIPYITIFGALTLMPVVMLSGIFLVYLGCRSGLVAACVFSVATMIVNALFLGGPLMWLNLIASLLLGIWVLRDAVNRKPFFEQMKHAAVAFGAGLIAALLIARAVYGGSIIADLMGQVRQGIASLPDQAYAPYLEIVNGMLEQSGLDATQTITAGSYREMAVAVVDQMQQTLGMSISAMLLSGCALSVLLSVFWGNWTLAKRGLATNESFIGMAQWFMPGSMAFGLLGVWLVTVFIYASGTFTGQAVFTASNALIAVAFCTQGLCALNRRMCANGASTRRRRVMIALMAAACLLFSAVRLVVALTGVASALFGSKGAIREKLRKKE